MHFLWPILCTSILFALFMANFVHINLTCTVYGQFCAHQYHMHCLWPILCTSILPALFMANFVHINPNYTIYGQFCVLVSPTLLMCIYLA